uniref:Uncharacterized protein n=1 Tax=Rhodosorus marinus TaxID=101924 RepID=A0A7S0G1Z3_9RHOD|mmetsp:Transcript_17594/g.25304  ORF Transcript_17594/g.25304 Transcript_17594/m.25304 type:complete len:328 (+) Transcript_17594:183-1166(+)|eukprot:CAMPEP_0184742238 /NCGR_PEP_ID=MMETSP0315-20130426/5232_1 /TAXON_ID=101924 /ORGANISM="Rhodosorus marinus, Strain UTEX LB 2760" /LENGTH=327 /DNA_ID=CAMNT_0027212989 /DNA_START=165 /DNA_END=1148 /DNA_ORIENTATION=-
MAFVVGAGPNLFLGCSGGARKANSAREGTNKVIMGLNQRQRRYRFEEQFTDLMKERLGETVTALPEAEVRAEDKPFVVDTDRILEIMADPALFPAPPAEMRPLYDPIDFAPRPEDAYMADKITKAYKAKTMVNGIYSTMCTEGTTKGAADIARVRALAYEFRQKQKPMNLRKRELYENRKEAIISANGCHTEEVMFSKSRAATRAYNMKKSESAMACSKYAMPESLAENYMAECVNKQLLVKAVPNGVYGFNCLDGSTKDHAEQLRVATVASAFRTSQMSEGVRQAARRAQVKQALALYAHNCSHEELLFTAFPAVAAMMRGGAYGK